MATRSKQKSLPGLGNDPADGEGAAKPEVVASPVRAKSRPVAAAGGTPGPVDISGWRVYAVDAHSLIFQVFHALPEMTSPRGEHVGAVYGFVRDMFDLIEKKQPDALICAFDLPGGTFRDKLFDRYKAERGEMPAE